MNEVNSTPEFFKYLKSTSPSEIDVDKEEIFYREKYGDIINYFKLMLTNSENLEVYNYMSPKGSMIINAKLGSDILEYIKLIASNYYLELLELNNSELYKTPVEFYNNINNILREFYENKEDKEDESEKKKLILINQSRDFKNILEEKSLLGNLIRNYQDKKEKIDFLSNNAILVWVTYDYQDILDISESLYEFFDLFIKIPILSNNERETIFRAFSEKNAKIAFDINSIVSITENWEVNDLKQLLRVAILKHYLNAELNDTSNEITNVILELINTGEFIPSAAVIVSKNREYDNDNHTVKDKINQIHVKGEIEPDDIRDVKTLVKDIRDQGYSEFMVSQLYENAASKNYSELLLVIDKLDKSEPLEDNDKKLLARYPFILNDPPKRAQINMEKAKKRVDVVKHALGKLSSVQNKRTCPRKLTKAARKKDFGNKETYSLKRSF